jgi:hypothetical protein
MNTNTDSLDKTIDIIEEIMRLAWDSLNEKDQNTITTAYAFALLRRIANKGMERP